MNTPSSSLTVDPLPSLDLPFKKTVGSKLDSLYEITYLSEEDKVSATELPLINPYTAYTKQSTSFTSTVKSLIGGPLQRVKSMFRPPKFDHTLFKPLS